MIIDSHTHLSSSWEDFDMVVPLKKSLRMMDKLGIDIACSSNSRSLRGDWRAGNKKVAESVKAHPDRIIGYGVFNPYYQDEIEDEFKRCFDDYGFRGVKLHYSHTGLPYTDPLYEPIFALAQERGLFVLVHCYDGGKTIEKVAGQFPEVKILLGHGGAYHWDKAIPVVQKYPNLYLEICCSCIENGRIEKMVEGVGAERVIFGTDMPLIDPIISIAAIKYADISDKEKEKILYTNMAQILGMGKSGAAK